jgi:cell wall-associated NlpC family hydrolase
VGRFIVISAAIVFAAVMSIAIVVAAMFGSAGPSNSAASAAPGGSSAGTETSLPAGWVGLEHAAAARCPGLPWNVLAAIGSVESDSGRSQLPGVASGSNGAGAQGPFQFEPRTFAFYAVVGPGGADPASPYDPIDAAYTASAFLCANGGGSAQRLATAVFAYNHDASYVRTVLALAVAYGDDPSVTRTAIGALRFASAHLGIPYLWGGNGPGGFDCSGLTRAAYAAVGITLPRVAQDQMNAGPLVGDISVRPGDLVFFGTGVRTVDHVGIYLGSGMMIDAPHTGAVVRIDAAGWSDAVGVTRPG